MRIRSATRADVEAVGALERSIYGDDAYPGIFLYQALDLWPELVGVAELEDRVAGYVLGAPSLVPGQAWLLAMAVRPEARRRGVGRALLAFLLRRLRALGFQQVLLTVHPENGSAVNLYRACGFGTAEELPSYFGPGEPRLRMVADLTEGAGDAA